MISPISIHAPRVGRDYFTQTDKQEIAISIHAPRVGRDLPLKRPPPPAAHFNPRAPCGARLSITAAASAPTVFQSTRPVWGATPAPGPMRLRGEDFNPRAPCGARRNPAAHAAGMDLRFQSTRPVWGATGFIPCKAGSVVNFNPRAPCGARPVGVADTIGFSIFQSTRPVWGATRLTTRSAWRARDFNPRAPCGARRRAVVDVVVDPCISIHAPRVGRDPGHARNGDFAADFNPRAPCGARRRALHTAWHTRNFNPRAPCGARHVYKVTFNSDIPISIHAPRVGRDQLQPPPMYGGGISIHAPRVGRDADAPAVIATINISIHAPRVGRDRRRWARMRHRRRFQSTRPVWGATAIGIQAARVEAISIHAPRVGRDPIAANPSTTAPISIHAPRVGRDEHAVVIIRIHCPFQSTRPVWGATFFDHFDGECSSFQSTRPVWGATKSPPNVPYVVHISIHAPRVGRDGVHGTGKLKSANFNPRAPCGARLMLLSQFYTLTDISIHAPRVGRDRNGAPAPPPSRYFNPRAPCGARLYSASGVYSQTMISIHAPRVGRDLAFDISRSSPAIFQSTRPVWGATRVALIQQYGIRNFNPRAPCGARRAEVIFAV